MPEYEVYLCHHGIKGMKWGVRRTAAQLGHLAKSGAKRAKGAYDVHRAKKKAEQEREERAKAEKKIRKTPLNKLSDDELKDRAKRLKAEKEIAQLENDIRNLRPSEQTAAKRFMRTVGQEIVKPAVVASAKKALTNLLDKVGGYYVQQASNAFKEAVGDNQNKNNQNQNKNNQNQNKNNQNQNKNNQNQNKNDQNKPANDASPWPDLTPQEGARLLDMTTGGKARDMLKGNDKPRTSSDKKAPSNKNEPAKVVYEGEVIGNGTSRRNTGNSKSSKSTKKMDRVYADLDSITMDMLERNRKLLN